MMPLVMMNMGERYTIYKIGGKEETKKFLESLGFVTGGTVTVRGGRKPDCGCEGDKDCHWQGYGCQNNGSVELQDATDGKAARMIRVDTKMQKELIIQKLKEQSCRITKQRQMILDRF